MEVAPKLVDRTYYALTGLSRYEGKDAGAQGRARHELRSLLRLNDIVPTTTTCRCDHQQRDEYKKRRATASAPEDGR